MVLVYCKLGLVSPVVDPACGGFFFTDEAIRFDLSTFGAHVLRHSQGVVCKGQSLRRGRLTAAQASITC
jgi:hypothetical protein